MATGGKKGGMGVTLEILFKFLQFIEKHIIKKKNVYNIMNFFFLIPNGILSGVPT